MIAPSFDVGGVPGFTPKSSPLLSNFTSPDAPHPLTAASPPFTRKKKPTPLDTTDGKFFFGRSRTNSGSKTPKTPKTPLLNMMFRRDRGFSDGPCVNGYGTGDQEPWKEDESRYSKFIGRAPTPVQDASEAEDDNDDETSGDHASETNTIRGAPSSTSDLITFDDDDSTGLGNSHQSDYGEDTSNTSYDAEAEPERSGFLARTTNKSANIGLFFSKFKKPAHPPVSLFDF
ncbi:hypothetical protein EJ08DRAFT_435611 [Tothia fuscella]|uniref:Uncharacterized protein n=1 Tax=Tothia fuscella TaxID=1048955 RepID=A0A9P4P066_9PEZI|nr:hypothetical protein EJ08DRAFT_435611 [Tothia fuscella]